MISWEDQIARTVYTTMATPKGRGRLRELFNCMITDKNLPVSVRQQAMEAISRLDEMDQAGAQGSA